MGALTLGNVERWASYCLLLHCCSCVLATAYCFTAVGPNGLSISCPGGVTWHGNGDWHWTPWGRVLPHFQHTLAGYV